MTGSANCEEVVRQTLGADPTAHAFWSTGIRAMEPALIEHERLAR